MNAPENQLARTLTDKAERFAVQHGSDLTLDGVLARAGEIRRGRRMRATMVMAAVVLAVAVPVGITVIGSDPKSNPGPPPAVQVNNDPIGLAALETGETPKTGYASGDILYGAGDSITLGEGGQPIYLARMDGGFLVGRSDPETGDTIASFVDADDSSTQTWPMDTGFAVSRDGRTGAFVQPDGTVIAVDAAGDPVELGTIPSGSGFEALEVSGDCANACSVTVTSRGEQPATWQIDSGGTPTRIDTGLVAPADARDRTYAGISRANEDMTTCSAVTQNAVEMWSTCPDGAPYGKRLLTFSPDGKHLLATGSVGSGEGDSELAILDADTGEVKADLRTVQSAVIWQMIWEDDRHVLALVREGTQFAVLRIGPDGSREYALAPEDGVDDLTPPFRLSAD